MNSSIIAKLYIMAEIAGRGVSFVGEGKPYKTGIGNIRLVLWEKGMDDSCFCACVLLY